MRVRTRKKRGGMPVEGPEDEATAGPADPPIEYVIKNTPANINDFRTSTEHPLSPAEAVQRNTPGS